VCSTRESTAAQSGWRTILQREESAYYLNASTGSGTLLPGGGATLNGATRDLSGPTASPVNSWTHVAVTYDGATLRLYVNGVQEGTPQTIVTLPAGNTAWYIGSNSFSSYTYFDGRIDEVAIWHTAFDAATVAAVTAGTLRPVDPALS